MPLAALFGRKQERITQFEQGRIGYAVGDVHGRLDLLKRMLERIEQDASSAGARNPLVVLLGDYVDRGPDSAGVIEFLRSQAPENFELRFLKGNHEAAMLAFLEDPIAHRGWLAHGGLETMASYGVRPLPPMMASDDVIGAAARRLRLALPGEHLDFLERLERYVVAGDYAFVHAGVDCGRPLDEQSDEELFWARKRFLADRRRFSHVVVHGHTPVEAPYCDDRRICIDTGAYATGRLTAAKFDDERVSVMTIDMEEGGGAAAYWAALK
jgi:serine/threonine protein phosphatase 1